MAAELGQPEQSPAHLEAALRIDPDYPENHICMAEACVQWDN